MSAFGMHQIFITVLLFKLNLLSFSLEIQDVVILILNQQDEFNSRQAMELEESIYKQTGHLNEIPPNVVLADTFSDPGHWIITPVLRRLSEDKAEKEWIVVTPGDSVINVEVLVKTLIKYNSSKVTVTTVFTHKCKEEHTERSGLVINGLYSKTVPYSFKEVFLGHALRDASSTIIHHFSSAQMTYPYLPAGIALSRALVHRARGLLRNLTSGDAFTIDVGYEFAKLLNPSGKGPRLTHEDAFCSDCSSGCAVCPQPILTCGVPIPADDLLIGVKTYHGFHSDRIAVVKKTWAPYAKHIVFYSDKEDPEIPTKNLRIPNVPQGHCEKTMSILDDMDRVLTSKDFKWFAIVDDDTILSVGRLRQFLSCYDPSEPIVIGERYGYFVTYPHGYSYPTGGAGMIFSVAAIRILASVKCNCPSPSTPDDMHIGLCLQRYSIPIAHSPLFHQALPVDYALPGTPSRPPITFHRHFLIDPHEVYAEHFEQVDREVAAIDALLNSRIKPTLSFDSLRNEL